MIGPDGQPDGLGARQRARAPRRPARATADDDDDDGERALTDLVEQPAKVMRIGSMIRQLLEEVKAAPARRGQPHPAQGDPPGLDQGARGRAGARAGRGAGAALAAVHRGRHARPRASCGSPRPSWSAGSRACSTASRPRSTPSRWPPARSSSRSGRRCRPVRRCRRQGRQAASDERRQPQRPGESGRDVPLGAVVSCRRDRQPTSSRPSRPDDHQRGPGRGEPGERRRARRRRPW